MLSLEAYQTLNSPHLSREVRAMEAKKSLRRGSGGPEDHPAGLVSPVAKPRFLRAKHPLLCASIHARGAGDDMQLLRSLVGSLIRERYRPFAAGNTPYCTYSEAIRVCRESRCSPPVLRPAEQSEEASARSSVSQLELPISSDEIRHEERQGETWGRCLRDTCDERVSPRGCQG
jgi:hypothetical protein